MDSGQIEIEQLIDDALAVLPDIGRNLFKGVASDPLAEGRSLGQMKVIACLHRHGRLPVKAVAAELGVTTPTASELIDKLVDDELLRREENPHDRRQVLVALTPTADAFGRRYHNLRRAQIRYAFDMLEPEERPIFLKSLRVWSEALKMDREELMASSDNTIAQVSGATVAIATIFAANFISGCFVF